MATPHTLEDTVRVHDRAIYDWLGGLRVDYGSIDGTTRQNEPILRVMASPQRAFAAIVNILVRTGWISGSTAQDMRDNAGDFAVLPLPIATIEASLPEDDPELSGVPKKFPKKDFDFQSGQWIEHRWPGHYMTDYTVTFWALKKYTAVFIDEWIRGQLGQVGRGNYETLIPVEHEQPWGTLLQSLTLRSATDRSDLEGREQRYMRWEYTFRLRTWVMYAETQSHTPVHQTVPKYFDLGKRRGTRENQPQIGSGKRDFTGNLFFWVDDKPSIDNWPLEGNATIEDASSIVPPDATNPHAPTIQVGVEGSGDSAVLVTELASRNQGDVGVVYENFRYASDGPFAIEIEQKDTDGTNVEVIDRAELPASPGGWQRFSRLVAVTRPVYTIRVRGRGVAPAREILLHGVTARNLVPGTRRNATGASKSGGVVTFTWDFLTNHSTYFVIAEVPPAASGGTITVSDDSSNPSYSETRDYDSARNAGQVFAVSPKDTTIRLSIDGPDPSVVYVQEVPSFAELAIDGR